MSCVWVQQSFYLKTIHFLTISSRAHGKVWDFLCFALQQTPDYNFSLFQLVCQRIKICHKIKFNKRFGRKFSQRCVSLVSICCAVLITKQLTVFVKLSILSSKQRVYELIFRSCFWKISHVSLLVFLSKGFSKLCFLHIWFITSGRVDMSHFSGVGIFWVGLNPTYLGCWRMTLSR